MKKLARLTMNDQRSFAVAPSRIGTFETVSDEERAANPGARCAAWIDMEGKGRYVGFFLADSFSRLSAIAGRAGERVTIHTAAGKAISIRPDDVEDMVEGKAEDESSLTVIKLSIVNFHGQQLTFVATEKVVELMDLCGAEDEPEYDIDTSLVGGGDDFVDDDFDEENEEILEAEAREQENREIALAEDAAEQENENNG